MWYNELIKYCGTWFDQFVRGFQQQRVARYCQRQHQRVVCEPERQRLQQQQPGQQRLCGCARFVLNSILRNTGKKKGFHVPVPL